MILFTEGGKGNVNETKFKKRNVGKRRDRGAYWAAISGVAQSRTRLKRLSSSSSAFLTKINSVFLYIFLLSDRMVKSLLKRYH